MSQVPKGNQSNPSAQTNPSSNSTAQSTAGRNNANSGGQQSFPPINSAQTQSSASQQQQQPQSSQANQNDHLPVLNNQSQNPGISIDSDSSDEEQKHQAQPAPPHQPPPPSSSSSSDSKSGSSGKTSGSSKAQGKDEDSRKAKTPKYPFGLKEEPKKGRPTRGIKIDNLEKYLKEKDYQSFINEVEIVGLFADNKTSTTAYVLLIAGYILTKKTFLISNVIHRFCDNNKLDKDVNDKLLGLIVSAISDQNSIEMWNNLISVYEKVLPKQSCLLEYSKLFPLITQSMKEVLNKNDMELSEQQKKMRLYLLENKNNKDKTFSTINECAKNLTEVDPNVAK